MRASKNRGVQNERGVALIIVLLVTTLLIALVFEFAYGTRVSFRAATNFRDSQRAYFLARSGVTYFVKNPSVRDYLRQGEWGVVPIVSGGDTEVKVMWEDEQGKLNINSIDTQPMTACIDKLFIDQGVATEVFDRIKERKAKEGTYKLMSELQTMMRDEDFIKVAPFLTTHYNGQSVNLNTAKIEVLKSIGCSESAAKTLDELRSREKFTDIEKIKIYCTFVLPINSLNLPEKVSFYTIYSHTTVGGYTKQVETVVGGSIPYWKAL